MSARETKDRLEELRARLAEKCENLQRRRAALLSKMHDKAAASNAISSESAKQDHQVEVTDTTKSGSVPGGGATNTDINDRICEGKRNIQPANGDFMHIPLAPRKSGRNWMQGF